MVAFSREVLNGRTLQILRAISTRYLQDVSDDPLAWWSSLKPDNCQHVSFSAKEFKICIEQAKVGLKMYVYIQVNADEFCCYECVFNI